MSIKPFFILDEDKAWARQRIAELEQAILDLGPEFHTALNESNETWHDNAPFDALRDEQALMVAEMQQLKEHLAKAAISIPKLKKNTTGIGSYVTLQTESSKEKHFLLAGNWTPRAAQEENGVMTISCESPIGQLLLGKKIGNTVALGPRKQEYVIVKVDNLV